MDGSSGTIVVGVDGSVPAQRALEWAVAQAVLEGRGLTLVHGLGIAHAIWPDVYVPMPQSAMTRAMQAGEKLVGEARQHVRVLAPELEVAEVVAFEDPRTLLLEHSSRAHLLVLGSRGRGPVTSLLLGSVSVAVVRHTQCPVVVHREAAGASPGGPLGGVLVACDARADSLAVLDFAFRRADLTGLPLTVLHCWSYGYDSSGEDAELTATHDLEVERLEVAEALAGFAEKYPGVTAEVELAHGLTGVRAVERGEGMDLVVVGLHRGSWRQGVINPISVAIVEHATTPVAVVPVGGPAAAS
jgi:nucleotide-binding universal stress UspA family protein